MLALILGGSGSGKSEYAERLLTELLTKPRIYIATMQPFDEEGRLRVAKHRKMREKKEFGTIERYSGHSELTIPHGSAVLLECMSNLVANEMYTAGHGTKDVVEVVLQGVEHLRRQAKHIVIVSNNVFEDGVTYDKETGAYLSVLGKVNQKIASTADIVVELVHGIPISYKE